MQRPFGVLTVGAQMRIFDDVFAEKTSDDTALITAVQQGTTTPVQVGDILALEPGDAVEV